MFPRPPGPLKYSLSVDQWRDIIKNSLESKDADAYEMYKDCVGSKPAKLNPDLYYTREEFNAEYNNHYLILFPRGNKRKR